MNKELQIFIPLCDSIGKLFSPNVEIVLHDLKLQQLIHIVNPFSIREIGDKMINDVDDFNSLKEDIIGPYTKTNIDGTKLKTVSTVIRNTQNNAIGLICINFKVEVFENLFESLKMILNIEKTEVPPPALFSQDWKEHTHNIINKYLSINNLELKSLKIKEKKDLVFYLNEEGIFSIRNVVNYLCEVLDISRATIYKWLKETK